CPLEELEYENLSGAWLWLAGGGHLAAGFFAGLLRVASGDLLVPSGMKGPGPGFAYRAANHCLESAGLTERALVDVDEDSAEHNDGGDVVDDVAYGDGDSSEGSGARPQDDAGDEVRDAAAYDLPELKFLSGVEEPSVGRIHLRFAADDLSHVALPVGIGRGPDHGLEPVQCLQPEEDNEAQAEPGVHDAAEWSAAEEGSEPAKQPREIDAEAREEREEKKERDHPVDHTRVDGMAQQLSAIDGGLAQV